MKKIIKTPQSYYATETLAQEEELPNNEASRKSSRKSSRISIKRILNFFMFSMREKKLIRELDTKSDKILEQDKELRKLKSKQRKSRRYTRYSVKKLIGLPDNKK